MIRSTISPLLTLTASSTPPFLCSRTFSIFNPHLLLHNRDFPFFRNRLQFVADSIMPRGRGRGIKHKEEKWQVKSSPTVSSSPIEGASVDRVEGISNSLRGVSLAEQSRQALAPASHMQSGGAVLQSHTAVPSQKAIWKPKFFGTLGGSTTTAPLEDVVAEQKGIEHGTHDKGSSRVSGDELLRGKLLENFTVDDNTYSHAQIRATFYPKFENEKSDQEIRTRMIEMVDRGLATVEVTLKHSGSLFMYAGHNGGAYAKNSFGNIYTAVGVFVLGRTLREAWGVQSSKKQAEFNEYLERNKMCISMELVTAVLGDHGQRPREDYVVVTAITELGVGKPKFYSTPDIIAFCRKWRLPTNHVWLFSTRKSVTSFFAAFDALCEEGTATSVCKAFDALCEEGMTTSNCKALDSEVANISVPASKDHVMVQGEILEGLVARMVSPESFKQMKNVLRDYPLAPMESAELDLGPSLRQICAANRSDEKQQIKALLQEVGTSFCPDYVDWLGKGGDADSRTADRSLVTKFLQAHPADYSTRKLQEMIRLMKDKRFQASFKCYYNLHKAGSMSKDDVYCKMVIHVHSDSVFRRYQKEMRRDPGLWPLYRGFFIDLNLFRGNKERAGKMGNNSNMLNTINGDSDATRTDSLADQDANLMVKLKFLTYKLRTFLIRNGLPILFKDGPAAYRTYYLRQMKIWGTSAAKQKELSKMLDEWAVYVKRQCGSRQLKSNIYLSEAEPFLEQYARKSAANQALIGAAGNLVRCEDFLAIVGGMDEEGDLQKEQDIEPPALSPDSKEVARKEGLIVFFPGIPGCAKSALCKELLNAGGAFGDNHPVQSLMGDLIKGRYWQQVADVCKKKPNTIMLADKNAPNEEVWKQIEQMCVANRVCAVPVVPDSAGTDSNPFSLDALAVFMYRVLQRVNHPGNLDKSSPNAGFVLLMFYHLYEGKSRSEFEAELIERFGSIVKIPLLRPERSCLPDSLRSKLEEGINLYRLHTKRHRRLESTKGSYAKEWEKWEKELRETLLGSAEYLNFIQVPFESAVKTVTEQLKAIAKGDYTPPSSEKKRLGAIVFACVTLPVNEIHGFINDFSKTHPDVEAFFKNKNLTDSLKKAHVTLAHKRSHGVVAVANYAQFLNRKVPVEMIAFLFSDKLAALEVRIGSVDGEKIIPKNEWPHVTLWTAQGVPPKEANTLPQLVAQRNAARVEIEPTMSITGEVMFS